MNERGCSILSITIVFYRKINAFPCIINAIRRDTVNARMTYDHNVNIFIKL